MDICFINGSFPPQINGGAENYIIRTANELMSRGHNVTVITTKPLKKVDDISIEKTKIEGITTFKFSPINISSRYSFPEKSTIEQTIWRCFDLINPHSAFVVKKLLSKIDPDVIHTNNLIGISSIITKALKQLDAKHVHTLHDYNLICPSGSPRTDVDRDCVRSFLNSEIVLRPFSRIQQSVLESPDIVTAPSQHIIDTHLNRGFFCSTPTSCLPLGVTTTKQISTKQELSYRALFVGRITERKGLDVLFEAAERDRKYQFDICGDGTYGERVKERSAKHSNVKYHGYVSSERLARLRDKADTAVVPSLWMENSPLTIYESFANGLPVVGSNIGGIPELISPGTNGELFTPGNAKSLINSLDSMMDQQKLANMRKEAIHWAENHTMEKHVNSLTKIYTK
ncbi:MULTISPECIES: glycosyltransferase family 4 protein [unclassified Halorubrum]|uniref:glycosyltransferase family 4 protein n=1 Tax=unclassified Halorubrum TaxID=2642239 RepID=UPI0013141AE9|nr:MULTISPECIES: glycosyltransferase family 4 protein [unclassified Halorubrum]